MEPRISFPLAVICGPSAAIAVWVFKSGSDLLLWQRRDLLSIDNGSGMLLRQRQYHVSFAFEAGRCSSPFGRLLLQYALLLISGLLR